MCSYHGDIRKIGLKYSIADYVEALTFYGYTVELICTNECEEHRIHTVYPWSVPHIERTPCESVYVCKCKTIGLNTIIPLKKIVTDLIDSFKINGGNDVFVRLLEKLATFSEENMELYFRVLTEVCRFAKRPLKFIESNWEHSRKNCRDTGWIPQATFFLIECVVFEYSDSRWFDTIMNDNFH